MAHDQEVVGSMVNAINFLKTSLQYHSVNRINFPKISKACLALIQSVNHNGLFGYCYNSVNVISLSKSQSDPIKRRTCKVLYYLQLLNLGQFYDINQKITI